MMKKLSLLIPAAGLLLGLAACADEGTMAKEPAPTSPAPSSPASTSPVNPVQGSVPSTNSSGAAPTAPGGGNGTGG
ncbi:MAG TPA: hypothetical protein VL752_02860 [Acidisoma sp.]|uniref:hypothetical protein n=1 Tax=Acidisoma sp. TaxID=1872115 RepID=UPI002C95912C|nr:hypothetical protein [Acidisoma sp.]HTH99863.1 hypothetical protein [Acidisoma sp.]